MPYSDRFTQALIYAAEIHRDQIRKGSNVPYVTHVISVGAMVGEAGGTEDQVIAGLMHDAIEDCIDAIPEIRRELRERFGPAVLTMVEACTDADTIPKPPWRERKEKYVTKLRATDPSSPFLLVSLADKLHNARSIRRDRRAIGEDIWDRFTGGKEGTRWYYRELATAFARLCPGVMADELSEIAGELGTD